MTDRGIFIYMYTHTHNYIYTITFHGYTSTTNNMPMCVCVFRLPKHGCSQLMCAYTPVPTCDWANSFIVQNKPQKFYFSKVFK